MKYLKKSTKTQLSNSQHAPAHLQYDAGNPDHVALPDENPFFSKLPEGFELQYDGAGIPTSLQAIPNYQLDILKADKILAVENKFFELAEADGIPVSYQAARQDLLMRGLPPSPTAAQQQLYSNVGVADAAIALINSYYDLAQVQAFDAAIPTGGSWF